MVDQIHGHSGTLDSLSEVKKDAQKEKSNRPLVMRWLEELERSKEEQEKYLERVDRIHKRYKDEREDRARGGSRFSFLWANVQSMQPVIYGRPPKPVAERNFKKRDPVTIKACEMIERNLVKSMSRSDFHEEAKLVRDDCILGARGITWERYVPIMGKVDNQIYLQPVIDQATQMPTGFWTNVDTQEPVELQEGEIPQQDPQTGGYVITRQEDGVIDELSITDFVHRSDFRHNKARKWKDEIRWVARRSFLDKDTFAARFDKPEEGLLLSQKVKPDHCPQGVNPEDQKNEVFKKFTVWEIWDKESHCIYWISPAYKDDYLDHERDFLKLEKFFPCARPVLWNITSDSLIPTPDFIHLQDLADELDEVTDRIANLTKVIKLISVHDSSHPELATFVTKSKDFQSIPVKNWVDFAAKGGLLGTIQFLPLDQMTASLGVLYQRQTALKQELYEMSGQGSVTRGETDPNKTATAVAAESKYSSQRMEDRQSDFAAHLRDALTIKAEIICEHFEAERIVQIADEDPADPIVQQAIQLIKDEKMRGFKISIETDSTIAIDEQSEQENRVQFGDMIASFLERMTAATLQDPETAPVWFALLKDLARGNRVGRDIEQTIDDTLEQKMGSIQQQLQNPPPDPAQQEMQLKQQEMDMNAQATQQKLGLEQQKVQGQMQLAATKLAAELQMEHAAMQANHAMKGQEMQMRHQQAMHMH